MRALLLVAIVCIISSASAQQIDPEIYARIFGPSLSRPLSLVRIISSTSAQQIDPEIVDVRRPGLLALAELARVLKPVGRYDMP